MRGKFIPALCCLLTQVSDLILAAVYILLIIIIFLISLSPVDLQAALLSLELIGPAWQINLSMHPNLDPLGATDNLVHLLFTLHMSH